MPAHRPNLASESERTGDTRAQALLQAPSLAAVPGVVHGFTTRRGGVSTGPFATLNLGVSGGDSPEAVAANWRLVTEQLDATQRRLVTVAQVHGARVVRVDRDTTGRLEADALWSEDARVIAAILVADCVPILLAERSGRAVAAVHAGWRGTRQHVGAATVAVLAAAGYPPATLRAAIGPAIGPERFEIGEDVAHELRTAYPDAGDAIVQRPDATGRRRWWAHLWALNRADLVGAGVPETAIDVLPYCTVTHAQSFFSYRRDGARSGRQAAVIGAAHTPVRP